jgi:hypothetical protein
VSRATQPRIAVTVLIPQLARGGAELVATEIASRVDRTKQLFEGMTPKQVDAVRASYIKQFGCDPEIHIRSDDLGQPIHRLDRAVELEMVGALNGPQMKQDAAALAGLVLDPANPKAQAQLCATGFRDTTRIASGSPEMWRDISLANRDALLAEVNAYRAELDRIAGLVAASDGAALEAVFERASSARREWGARFGKGAGTGVAADGPREP